MYFIYVQDERILDNKLHGIASFLLNILFVFSHLASTLRVYFIVQYKTVRHTVERALKAK
jgi:hypothetical protein